MIRRLIALAGVAAIAAAAAWFILTRQPAPERWLGYAEADYIKVAPVQQGRLVALAVARGDTVAAGALLFTQDEASDLAARNQAAAQLAMEREKLADLQASGRADQIKQARAEVADAQAARDKVALELARNTAIVASGAVTRQSVDQLRADTRSAQAKLESAQARLSLMTDTSGRDHAMAAQEAAIRAAAAALVQAQWRLDQRRVVAPEAGVIADTLAQPGETMAAGAPVVSLLPPRNVLVRFFIPETALARVHLGDKVAVSCDSCGNRLTALVSFIATAPEYTPPVIYSESARGNLVYLIEARADPAHGMLKPGQPVEVTPPSIVAR